MKYSLAVIKTAEKLHQESASTLNFWEICASYKKHGHDEQSFLDNMRQRSIYSDLCDLDDIQIDFKINWLSDDIPEIIKEEYSEYMSDKFVNKKYPVIYTRKVRPVRDGQTGWQKWDNGYFGVDEPPDYGYPVPDGFWDD